MNTLGRPHPTGMTLVVLRLAVALSITMTFVSLSACQSTHSAAAAPQQPASKASSVQAAQAAMKEAIKLLETRNYDKLLDRFLPPEGGLSPEQRNTLVARFETGWGNLMLTKMKNVIKSAPELLPDGTVSFAMTGVALGPMTMPIVMKYSESRWYLFR